MLTLVSEVHSQGYDKIGVRTAKFLRFDHGQEYVNISARTAKFSEVHGQEYDKIWGSNCQISEGRGQEYVKTSAQTANFRGSGLGVGCMRGVR